MRAAKAAMALGAATGVALLAHVLEFDRPPSLDRRVRRLARDPSMDVVRRMLSPLFPIGLPGGYITAAHATSYWLRRRGKRGGRMIVSAAWLGWIVHRAMKIRYRRERPLRPGVRRRTDSYPSGHTTGMSAFAPTLAYVLRREGLISNSAAVAIGIGAPTLMGAYRVLADDHWTTDVIAGWMLGGAIALACSAVAPPSSNSKTHVRELESSSRSPRRLGRPERSASKA